MTLKDYLINHNLSVHQFAFLVRLSVPVIYRVLNNANISPKSAKRILACTREQVDYENIMSFNGEKALDGNN